MSHRSGANGLFLGKLTALLELMRLKIEELM